MLRFSFLLVLVSAVAVAQAPAPKPANINDSDNARKARAILEQAVEALGGQAYLTYDNKLEEGRYYPMYHGRSVSTGILYARYVRYPDKERFEVRHQSGSVKIDDKNDMVVIHNGDKGYEITFKGTGPEDKADTARYVRRRLHSLDWALRKWMNQPGVAFFFDGVSLVEGKTADQVTMLNDQNDSVSVFLDQGTHLPLKTSYAWRDPEDKQRNTEEELYDAYRPQQGIMTPHSVTRFFNGEMSLQRFISTVSYNLTLPDSTFEATLTYFDLKKPPKKN